MNDKQNTELIVHARAFLASPNVENEGVVLGYKEFDQRRVQAIPVLKKLIDHFLSDTISLKDFKEKSESLCREHPYWGFKSFSGQMQLNQYVNNIDDDKKEAVLKNAITPPKDEAEGRVKIDAVANYLRALKEKVENPKSIPRVSQAYMLSYFWEIQSPQQCPIYYGSLKKVLLSLGFNLDIFNSPGEEYLEFARIMKEVKNLYRAKGIDCGQHPFWFVEHVLWRHFMETMQGSFRLGKVKKEKRVEEDFKVAEEGGFGSWLPPIITDLQRLALNKETEWSKARNLKPEKAFETKLKYAFTLLAFETTELGQGTGREPDGVAISSGVADEVYAIIYDAKARENKYSVGTGDREIYEYIQRKKEELRRLRIGRSYFTIISSEFDEGASNLNLIREIYRKTQVPVTLLRASDLMLIIEAKLQDVSMDHKQLEYLFLDTGLITREKIIDVLGIR